MTIFIKLIDDGNKQAALNSAVTHLKSGTHEDRIFETTPNSFRNIPGAPFAYWVSERIRESFATLEAFKSNSREAEHGGSTKDDFRFLRLWWEPISSIGYPSKNWTLYAKGGTHSPYYADVTVCVKWAHDAKEIEAAVLKKYPYLNGDANWILHRECKYFIPGLFQTLRSAQLAPHLTPSGCIFGHNGFQAAIPTDEIFSWLALLNSTACDSYLKLMLGRAGWALYTAGTMNRLPIPMMSPEVTEELSALGRKGWSLMRSHDIAEETSHAFQLPSSLLGRIGAEDEASIFSKLCHIKERINVIAFEAYGLTADEQNAISRLQDNAGADNDVDTEDIGGDDDNGPSKNTDVLSATLSWAIGVAFGRFDWRLATGERKPALEPNPFDELPEKSDGMLLVGDEPFHLSQGILVDDSGHEHDLVRLTEALLEQLQVNIPFELRKWLQRDFFVFHLQRYSRSRRKAPIYWPLSTASGSYTLWVYYPTLNNQTLFIAVNDFLDGPNGKLTHVNRTCHELRIKSNEWSRDEEKRYDSLQSLQQELIDLRDALLKLAPTYKPNHDDGVQVTAAPLWPFFRHKPWQKLLKDTWGKMEKGEFDWAHLAMNYWPERVREKCMSDKSLAIAHGVEELYIEPTATTKKAKKIKV